MLPKNQDHTANRQIAIERQSARMEVLREKLPERSYKALEKVPPKYIGRLTKALTGTKSRRLITRAMCEQCVGWENAPESIGKCTSYLCPLHPTRPHQ